MGQRRQAEKEVQTDRNSPPETFSKRGGREGKPKWFERKKKVAALCRSQKALLIWVPIVHEKGSQKYARPEKRGKEQALRRLGREGHRYEE